jgi:hypothetical protein
MNPTDDTKAQIQKQDNELYPESNGLGPEGGGDPKDINAEIGETLGEDAKEQLESGGLLNLADEVKKDEDNRRRAPNTATDEEQFVDPNSIKRAGDE